MLRQQQPYRIAVRSRGRFVINILDQRQEVLSDRFARPYQDHFEGLDLDTNEHDLPVIARRLGHLVCENHEVHPGGDHIIVVARVVEAESRSGMPLIFYRGTYDTLTGSGRDAYWYW